MEWYDASQSSWDSGWAQSAVSSPKAPAFAGRRGRRAPAVHDTHWQRLSDHWGPLPGHLSCTGQKRLLVRLLGTCTHLSSSLVSHKVTNGAKHASAREGPKSEKLRSNGQVVSPPEDLRNSSLSQQYRNPRSSPIFTNNPTPRHWQRCEPLGRVRWLESSPRL